MKSIARLRNKGFTLVELMIVVAIIGVLAALAIYGVRKYIASAKTSEAKNTIGAISRGAAAAFERETTQSQLLTTPGESTNANHALCNSAIPVPTKVPQGRKYQPNTANNTDFETGDALGGWRCLRFSLTQPIYYQYHYVRGASTVATNNPAKSSATGFEAAAVGDLDGDNTLARFARTGDVKNGNLIMATQVYVENEFE